MFVQSKSILVTPLAARLAVALLALGGLAACGQKGDLYLPAGEAAAGRASLPQTLLPGTATTAPVSPTSASPASTLPASGASAPVRAP